MFENKTKIKEKIPAYVNACFTDDAVMAAALNRRKSFSKDGHPYNKFSKEEARVLLAALKEKSGDFLSQQGATCNVNGATYSVNDTQRPRIQDCELSGFTQDELNKFTFLDKLLIESIVWGFHRPEIEKSLQTEMYNAIQEFTTTAKKVGSDQVMINKIEKTKEEYKSIEVGLHRMIALEVMKKLENIKKTLEEVKKAVDTFISENDLLDKVRQKSEYLKDFHEAFAENVFSELGYSKDEMDDFFCKKDISFFGAVFTHFNLTFKGNKNFHDHDYRNLLRTVLAKKSITRPVLLVKNQTDLKSINTYLFECDKLMYLKDKECTPEKTKKILEKLSIEMKSLRKESNLSLQEQINILQAINTAVEKPSADSAANCINKAAELFPRPKTQILGGLMLMLGGITLVAASAAVCAVSFGLFSPVSIGGVVLGASLLHAGYAIAAGVWGLGMTASGGFKMFDKEPIRKDLEKLGKEVKKTPR
jgi:hypothetical protein